MTTKRRKELEGNLASILTDEEQAEGWHWCLEFDALLVGPGMPELNACKCLAVSHPVYKTAPPPPPDEPMTFNEI